jgi:chromosome segregation ATPase
MNDVDVGTVLAKIEELREELRGDVADIRRDVATLQLQLAEARGQDLLSRSTDQERRLRVMEGQLQSAESHRKEMERGAADREGRIRLLEAWRWGLAGGLALVVVLIPIVVRFFA